MNIDGKVIVITGAARGIGQEYARYLGGLGARIVAADINDCSSTLDLVKAESGTAVGAKLDESSRPQSRTRWDDSTRTTPLPRTFGSLSPPRSNPSRT